ncbi:hypothetical protein Q0601_05350, partial [Paracoccus onubensis]|uniref:hypothetical protein n=1 Tax=Paracoccus onubensis TaxID=1675788 RepID=UPI00272FCEF2
DDQFVVLYFVEVQLLMPKGITLDSQDESRQPFAQQSLVIPSPSVSAAMSSIVIIVVPIETAMMKSMTPAIIIIVMIPARIMTKAISAIEL